MAAPICTLALIALLSGTSPLRESVCNSDDMLFVWVPAAVDVRLGMCTVDQSCVATAHTTDRRSTAFIYGAPLRQFGCKNRHTRLHAPHGGGGSLNASRSIHGRRGGRCCCRVCIHVTKEQNEGKDRHLHRVGVAVVAWLSHAKYTSSYKLQELAVRQMPVP